MEENKKKDNPLSVRVDSDLKEKFDALTEGKGLTKKTMMEHLILSYIKQEEDNEREDVLHFKSEVNLISTSLNDILSIIEKMVSKSQNTVISQKENYEQQIKNLNNQLNTYKEKIEELENKYDLFEAAQEGYEAKKVEMDEEIHNLQQKLNEERKYCDEANHKHRVLLEQLNDLRGIERQNESLNNDRKELNQEKKKLENSIKGKEDEINSLVRRLQLVSEEKDNTIKILEQRLEAFNHSLIEKNKFLEQEKDEIESNIRKELELEAKETQLQFQTQYNELQIKNMENMKLILEKDTIIQELRKELALKDNNTII